MSLLDTPPEIDLTAVKREGANTLTNGNLKVDIDPSTGCVTATRVSDGKVLLKQTSLTFEAPVHKGLKPGSVATTATFATTPDEKVYGLGEHRTGNITRKPYRSGPSPPPALSCACMTADRSQLRRAHAAKSSRTRSSTHTRTARTPVSRGTPRPRATDLCGTFPRMAPST